MIVKLSIHKKIFNDEVLIKVLQKELKNHAFKLSAVLAAITRNEDAMDVDVGSANMNPPLDGSGAVSAVELVSGAVDVDSGEDYSEEEDEYYEACR
ncbi:hypothetical protein Hypma_003272 [Hypsizygus marmoreus]|uniref:Uncharacterized protein n=1 Tax=Hypsizygus marmoreus TaxID=39966 RepID=A0A369K9V5_HYPMA|nr:hypothetical protein Hypma_003272 [Hypsizygus marmoreus]